LSSTQSTSASEKRPGPDLEVGTTEDPLILNTYTESISKASSIKTTNQENGSLFIPKVGEYVGAIYEDQWYIGKVLEVDMVL
jgi:hypothetical protein